MKQIVDALDARQAVLVAAAGAAGDVRPAARCPPRCSPSCATSCSCGCPSARSGAWRCRCSGICMRCRLRFHLERQTGGRVARHRARHARHLDAADLHAVLDHPGGAGVRPGRGGAAVASSTGASPPSPSSPWWCTWGSPSGVTEWRMDDSPPRQRARLQGQHPRHRQPAQLRDGEVLQQRGLRGAPLRRQPAQVRERGGAQRSLAGPAQHRPER